jgi:hypothetical protein
VARVGWPREFQAGELGQSDSCGEWQAGKAVVESNSRCGEQATSKDTQGNPGI